MTFFQTCFVSFRMRTLARILILILSCATLPLTQSFAVPDQKMSNKTCFYKDGKLVAETIESESLLRFSQAGPPRFFLYFFGRLLSKACGWFMNSRLSVKRIEPFIKKYAINMSEFEVPRKGFSSFNDFFIRKLSPEARAIDDDQKAIIAPADSKLLVIPRLTPETRFFVKSKRFCLQSFLRDKALSEKYKGGTLLLFRLAPYDYHRFHFPCDCVPSRAKRLRGSLSSVHPIAYKKGRQPLLENERQVVMLQAKEFGIVTIVPVGALMVGKIVHTYAPGKKYEKGDEMGYFSFGGSTLVLLFEKDMLHIEQEFETHSKENYETAVVMGQRVAVKRVL